MTEKKLIGTVDMTPTWAEVVEILLDAVGNGNARQQEEARSEIRRMATIADAYNATQQAITSALKGSTETLDEFLRRIKR